jgi:hypothetical protein
MLVMSTTRTIMRLWVLETDTSFTDDRILDVVTGAIAHSYYSRRIDAGSRARLPAERERHQNA